MSKAVTKDSLFKPPASKAETKAETTNQAARSIVEAEVATREAKTARLKQARLAKEAQERKDAPPPKPAKPRAKRSPAK